MKRKPTPQETVRAVYTLAEWLLAVLTWRGQHRRGRGYRGRKGLRRGRV